jgi:heptosyltransferase II
MKRCLLLCPIGIGNYLLAYPSFFSLKQNFPECDFYLIALRQAIASLAQNDPLFAGILTIDPYKNRGALSLFKSMLAIRALKCDTAISFFPSNRFEYNALMFFSGAKRRVAFSYKQKKCRSATFLANARLPVEEKLHDVLQNLRVLPVLEATKPTPITFPSLFTEKDQKAADAYISQMVPAGQRILGIHAGSSPEHGMDCKRWSLENFALLAKNLVRDYSFKVLIFGGPEEVWAKRQLAAAIGKDAFSVEGLSLQETAAAISRCRIFISNDSGLMHVAALSGVPTAGIFGPTDDTRTAPWGEKHLIIRNPDFNCSPCWTIQNVGIREKCKFGDTRCLGQLSVEKVYGQIENWIGREKLA